MVKGSPSGRRKAATGHFVLGARRAPVLVKMGPARYSDDRLGERQESNMAIAKTIEIIAASKTGIEDAVRSGLAKAAETVKGIEGAWIKDTRSLLITNRSPSGA